MSTLYSLNLKDFFKALLVVVLSAFLSSILAVLNNGWFPTVTDAKDALLASVTAGVAYLLKNFLTNSQNEFMKKETISNS